MLRTVILGVTAAVLFAPAAHGQNAVEVERIRKENDQLKKEIELLKKEVELLKKEANGKPGTDGRVGRSGKSITKATDDDDTDYELVNCVRVANTKRVTFTFLRWTGALLPRASRASISKL